jgi:hypothetical protein
VELTKAPLYAYPHACAVSGRDDGELIDFGVDLEGVDPHLYLRIGVVEEAGRLVGMVPKAEVEKLSERLNDLAEELVEAQKLLASYRKVEEGLSELQGASA